MNVQDYITAGYNLSPLIGQAAITRAEKEVTEAYIKPLVGHTPTESESAAEPLKTAIMRLSFLRISQQNISATRAGAKTKRTEASETPTYSEVLRQHAAMCAVALEAVGARPDKACTDICNIFFKTSYFHN